MQSPDLLEQRIEKLEAALGITGMSQPATLTHSSKMHCALPIGAVVITKTDTLSLSYGTWTLLDSGNLLGGQVGTVYAWRRTA